MSLLTIRLFGEFSVSDHRGNTLSIGNERTRALIAWLALHLTDLTPLREFAQQFGQEDAFVLARDLRYTMRFIGSDALIGEGELLRFNRSAIDVDVARFDALVASTAVNAVPATSPASTSGWPSGACATGAPPWPRSASCWPRR